MKQILLMIMMLLPVVCVGQYTQDDIFRKAPLTWLGLDFTRVRIEGYDYPDQQLREVHFVGWNEMVNKSDDPIKISKYLHRDKVDVYISEVNRLNTSATRNLRTSSSLHRDSILSSLSNYDFGNRSGIGVVMFVGEIIHKGEHLRGKIAFVDMKTRELLLLKNFEGNGRGGGFNDTWGNAIKSALGVVRRRWDNWEKEKG